MSAGWIECVNCRTGAVVTNTIELDDFFECHDSCWETLLDGSVDVRYDFGELE